MYLGKKIFNIMDFPILVYGFSFLAYYVPVDLMGSPRIHIPRFLFSPLGSPPLALPLLPLPLPLPPTPADTAALTMSFFGATSDLTVLVRHNPDLLLLLLLRLELDERLEGEREPERLGERPKAGLRWRLDRLETSERAGD